MATFTIAEGKNKFTAVIKQAENQPVEITRRGIPVAVILSVEEYQEFQRLKKKKRSFRDAYLEWLKHVDLEELNVTDEMFPRDRSPERGFRFDD